MINTAPHKEKLLAEKKKLEGELASVGQRNPSNPADWEPTPEKMDVSTADANEMADAMEEFEVRASINEKLEARLNSVTRALEKIEKETFGTCEECKKEIEEARLAADPAARTCIAHRRVKLE